MTMPPRAEAPQSDDGIRLQKVLAAAGLGSRRACEELIADGRVSVNGRPARLGLRIDPERDIVAVDGSQIPTASGLVYVAINKPRGMHSTMADDRGRPCVGDLVADITAPLHHVGRLDAESEGLLLLTNDGDLSHRLTHPSFGVTKTYLVEVEGSTGRGFERSLKTGVELDDGVMKADSAKVVESTSARSVIELSIHEGRKHVVRRAMETLGHPVTRLVRISVGPIRLGDLKPGGRRHLQQQEVQSLYRAVEMSS
ncbi:MAG TPA: pseudouridine synthase [Mycobacteriales bacterium]|jgi:23S rRNA pseudouridine2605 synthase|nr:pseudouridine synthase [Mycobacteriales bacterium]